MKNPPRHLRTWIELDASAAKKNYTVFRKLLGRKTKLWSVVKSNAYGHGLIVFAKLMDEFGVDGFCVDSIVEALALRREGIRKPILVLGQTLPALFGEAASRRITITISNFESLRALARAKRIPEFHLKIDTGMHRQGFYPEDVHEAARFLLARKLLARKLKGVYTHFAAAKDANYPTYTEFQFEQFMRACETLEHTGFKNLVKHAAATGGILLNKKYHLDAARAGIGLYGLWPSKELELQFGEKVRLMPVLSWRTAVAEVKKLKTGDYVGYDLTERVARPAVIAVLPVGYWHGLPRVLSGSGCVIIRGHESRILGRISMDMAVVEAPAGAKSGDIVTIIGRDGRGHIPVESHAAKSNTSNYEFITRLNPLMEKIVVRRTS